MDKKRGRGGSAKSPRLSTQGGGPLNVHVDQNLGISGGILYHCALEWVIKKINLNSIELNWFHLVVHNWKCVQIYPCIMLIRMGYMLIF